MRKKVIPQVRSTDYRVYVYGPSFLAGTHGYYIKHFTFPLGEIIVWVYIVCQEEKGE